MHQESTTIVVSSSIIHGHHQNCRPGPVAYPETAYQLVVDVLKIDRGWPYSRTSRLSRNLSIHNCLVVQTTVEFQYATLKGKADVENDFLMPWIKQVENFLSQPLGETEHLVAGCELIGGLIRASACWNTETQQLLWTLLLPCLNLALQKLYQEIFSDFLDAIRFGVDTVPPIDQMHSYIPLINFVLESNTPPNVVSPVLNNT